MIYFDRHIALLRGEWAIMDRNHLSKVKFEHDERHYKYFASQRKISEIYLTKLCAMIQPCVLYTFSS